MCVTKWMKLMFFVRGHYLFMALTVLTASSLNLMYNVYSTLWVIQHKFAESVTVHKGTFGDAFDSCLMGQNIENRKIIVSYVLLGSSIMAPRHYGSHTIIVAETMTF